MDYLVLLVTVMWTQMCLVGVGPGREKSMFLLHHFICTHEIDQSCNFELSDFFFFLGAGIKIHSSRKLCRGKHLGSDLGVSLIAS